MNESEAHREEKLIIACLGWGSLVWNPNGLPMQRHWFEDGPLVRAEFLRESDNGRITLVLHSSVPVPVRALWAILDATDPASAIDALGKREGMGKERRKRDIHIWKRDDESPPEILDLPLWAQARSVDAVIWTGLPPQFDGKEGTIAGPEKIIQRLSAMSGKLLNDSRDYIRYAPPQIDTPYRRKIEAALGWTPVKPPE
jgi:hypothetical protein